MAPRLLDGPVESLLQLVMAATTRRLAAAAR
jgi:hypothetical protein